MNKIERVKMNKTERVKMNKNIRDINNLSIIVSVSYLQWQWQYMTIRVYTYDICRTANHEFDKGSECASTKMKK